MKKFDFKSQMKVGNSGESDFKQYYAELEPLKSVEDLKYDFTLKNGKTIELKCDTYPMEKTPNFFMEYYSDVNKEKIGGPWRAAKDNIDYFCYYFNKNKVFYWFNPNELVSFLDTYIELNQPNYKYIGNRGWVTNGIAIDRDIVGHLVKRKDIF